MILEISDIEIFRIFFDVVLEDTDTVELKCDSNNVKVSLLSSDHVSFYEVIYDNTFFDVYDIDGTEIISLFVDDLYKILKTASKGDILTLSSNDTNVIAKFEHQDNVRVFELVQAENFTDNPTPPSINATALAKLEIDDLTQTLKDLDIIKTGSVELKCGEELTMNTYNETAFDYMHRISCEIEGEGSAYYTTDYLKKISKFKKIDKMVEFKWGDTLPLQWKVSNNWVTVSGLIAPRIEEQ